MRNNLANPHRVVVLVLENVVPFDLGVAARVFHEALDADGRATTRSRRARSAVPRYAPTPITASS